MFSRTQSATSSRVLPAAFSFAACQSSIPCPRDAASESMTTIFAPWYSCRSSIAAMTADW